MPQKIVIIHSDPTIDSFQPEEGTGAPVAEITDTVQSVKQALTQLGHSVQILPLRPPLSSAFNELDNIDADLVFNLFEGFNGWPESEAAIAHHLENLGVCFTGCSSRTLRICENKDLVRRYLQAFDIPTPQWQVLHPGRHDQFMLDFPCIVKPAGEHASRGLTEHSVIEDLPALRKQVEIIWQNYQQLSLAETFLPGREFRALITGNWDYNIYPIEEIVYSLPPDKPRLLTYAAKWVKGDEYFEGTRETCPAEVDRALKETIEKMAVRAYQVLDCRNYASIDLRQDKDGQLNVIDVNPNTDISMEGAARFPIEAQGVGYTDFIYEILRLAMEHHIMVKDRTGKIRAAT